jgi:hypothetical protein
MCSAMELQWADLQISGRLIYMGCHRLRLGCSAWKKECPE